jgi:glucokinase
MYIGIDLGGTNVRIAGSKNLDNIELVKIKRFELSHDFERDFAEIIRAVEEIAEGKVDGIGIGAPGTYNKDRSLLISGRNVIEWVNIPFIKKFSEKFNCPVFAENDAVATSLGEVFYGQENSNNFIYITWGTGIGGAIVDSNEGKIFSEKIDRHEYLEGFESDCGGKNLTERFKKEASELNDDEWAEVMNDFEKYLL